MSVDPSAGAIASELILSWVVTTGLSFAVVLLDERRLARVAEEKLERAWKPSSRDAALVAFGLLAIPVHFIKTRGSLKKPLGFLVGLALGVVAFLLVAIASTLVLEGVALVLGWPTD